ncbi:MAG: Omp28-related outer membrane protein [Ignavibacteriae bacterium]|nr:Omp28-related outer membrane protein [Ignavibacteriota bacterium]
MRYKITIIILIAFIFYNANSQQWVSTQVEKRNVILEEFTGIHCGYCPDGHKRANELVAANPGRVFLVNIHAGGYATPGAGEPDLRTTVGTPIDGASGLSGYPAGSVNRSTSPWAMDRGSWASAAYQIMGQNSPVNVAVKANVDFSNRTLTTEVEIYYTGNSSSQKNYLSVFLTQDNILGPQSDYGNYNPTNWTKDGKYRHNHVLRMAISSGGSFGEAIDTTTKDHYEYRKYVTTLPDNINSLDVVLYNLHVVAFVSENQSNIYSGSGTAVDFDPNLKVDLGLKNMTVYPTDFCFITIDPKIEVTNNSGKDITEFDVSLILDGVENVKSFTGNLAPYEKTIIDWGDLQYTPSGSYNLTFQGFKNINGNQVFDMDFTNDAESHSGFGFKSKAFSLFNGEFDGQMPNNLAFDQAENTNFLMVTNPRCGANGSLGAIRYALHSSWGVSGKPGNIIFGEADLSKLTQDYLCFYYAYSDGSNGGTAPQIKVQVSEDCGLTWNEIFSMNAVETGQPSNPQYMYIPASNEYKPVQLSLDAYKTKSVIIKIAGIPGTSGNALYIDEVTLGPSITEVGEETNTTELSLYPNPAENELHLGNPNFIGKNYSIYSVIGMITSKGINANNKIDISSLNSGNYYIKINNEILKFVKH